MIPKISITSQRKSIRLAHYDYANPNFYFITLCLQNRKCLLGNISKQKMYLNAIGKMIYSEWLSLPKRFEQIDLDEYIIMPDHLHGIIIIRPPPINMVAKNQHHVTPPVGATLVVAQNQHHVTPPAPVEATLVVAQNENHDIDRATTRVAPTVGRIIGAFKSITTNKYIEGIKKYNWPTFEKSIWQRNYYEHIIRNEESLYKIRNYIIDNPEKWK